jgi:phthalate 4,5-dioxygenase
MLSKEQNELLVRVGPGTPMGQVLRQFWVPVLRAAKLEADGAPARVRLFGENFVAFRDSQGRLGFLDEGCAHRGVSLALGRNEECGLRCIFHGWKYDVEGKVVDIPSEPVGSNLASKVRVKHYPVREAGGVIWVWLGKGETPTQFPAFEFTTLPLENIVPRKAIVPCNWLGLLEGLLDSSHISSLHRTWLPQGSRQMSGAFGGVMGALAPSYEIETRPYGYLANAKRALPDGTQVNRKTEYVLPVYAFILITFKDSGALLFPVPIDDENSTFWIIQWDKSAPLDAETFDRRANTGKLGPDPEDFYQPKYGPDQVWGQDRELMKQGHYSGLPAIALEDFAVQMSQGVIIDRSKEHLGASDIAVIRLRRLLLDLVKDYQHGKLPEMFNLNIAYDKIRAVHEIIPAPQEPVATGRANN